MTPNSAGSPYLTVAEFLNFVDYNLPAQLARDDQGVDTPTQLLTNPVVIAALGAASGELESAVLRGQRYAVADLQALIGTDPNNLSNSALHLQRIISGIAIMIVWDRRDAPNPPANVVRKFEWAEKQLELLASGDRIFSFAEVEGAGIPTDQFYTDSDLINNNMLTASMFRKMFGNRSNTRTHGLGF